MRGLFVLVLGLVLGPGLFASPGYDISSYEARFTVHPERSSVDVALDLTYRVFDTVKSEGFKYVGQGAISRLECTDGEGKPLPCSVDYQKETKLLWAFPPQKNSLFTVHVSFTLDQAVESQGSLAVLDLPWVGVFQVPVAQALWKVTIPGATWAQVVPFQGEPQSLVDGAVTFTQDPVKVRSMRVFWGTREALLAQVGPLDQVVSPVSGAFPWGSLGLFVLVIVGMTGVTVWLARRKRSGPSSGLDFGGDGGTSGGGCSGGSCGGGGCGGGCGG